MLCTNIRKLRMAKGISQVDLAYAIGVSKQSVSNWENDNIQPSIDILIKLADYFAVSTDYLLGRDQKQVLDISDLSLETATHLRLLIQDLRKL